MQVIQICEKKRKPQPKYILVDTPGQIEIFTWSASGAIITEAFASTFPTMVAYVVDTARSAAPQTFMSNMLQASPLCLSGAHAERLEQSVALQVTRPCLRTGKAPVHVTLLVVLLVLWRAQPPSCKTCREPQCF